MAIFEKRQSFHVSQQPPGWVVRGYGEESYAGENVTVEGSLSVTAVMAGFTILMEDTASLPLILFRRLERGKERATTSPYYRLLHDEPNPEHTSMVYREFILGHLLGWGNHYSQKIWDRNGVLRELWALRPDRMQVFRENGERKYIYTQANGQKRAFRQDEILHIPAFGFDGLMGYSRIALARNAIGLSMAAEKYGSGMFANGARPDAVLKSKKKLTTEAIKNLRESWKQLYGGSGNAGSVAVLEEDLDFTTIGFPPEDAQFLQTREFQISEISRIFRIPPHMIGDVNKSTSWGSGIEQQEMSYYAHTLRPWLIRIEQQMNKDLLLEDEKRNYFFEHLADAFLRTDTAGRYAAYGQAILQGWMTRNEARVKENMNPLEGLDEPLVPLNMTTPDGANDDNSDAPTDAKRTISPLMRDAADRILRRETNELKDAVKRWLEKDKEEKFSVWLEQFYKRDLPTYMAQILKPFVDGNHLDSARAQAIIDDYCAVRGEQAIVEPLEPNENDFMQLMRLFEEKSHA